jgi:hypothetical protein
MLPNRKRRAVFWMGVFVKIVMILSTSARSTEGSRGRVPRK